MHGLTDDQTWFYTPSAGWLGTTKEIWEVMDETSNYLWLYEQSNSNGLPIISNNLQVKFSGILKKSYFTYEGIHLILKIAQHTPIDLSTGGVAKAILI